MVKRVMYSFYILPSAKAEVERIAEERGEPAAETLRKLLSLGLQHRAKLPPPRGPQGIAGARAKLRREQP